MAKFSRGGTAPLPTATTSNDAKSATSKSSDNKRGAGQPRVDSASSQASVPLQESAFGKGGRVIGRDIQVVDNSVGNSKNSFTADIFKLFNDADGLLQGDWSLLYKDELSDKIFELTQTAYILAYNALDYANKRLEIMNRQALEYILDVRSKRITYSEQTLTRFDTRAVIIYNVISKLDMIDSSMSNNILLAIKQSIRQV